VADEPEDPSKRDLRYSSAESRGVRVDRSLDGSGHLARGDKTKMSVLNFSSRHPVRTERDPDFEFRPAGPRPVDPVAPPDPPAPSVAAPEAAATVAEPAPKSLLDKFKGMFGF